MKSEAYPPLTSLSPYVSPRLVYLFLSLSGLVSVFPKEKARERKRKAPSLSLSVEKREDIILLRTRHKVKYRRHKRRTRPWTSLVLRIGTNEEEKKKKRKPEREENAEGGTRRGRGRVPTGYSRRRGADERDRRAGKPLGRIMQLLHPPVREIS